MNFLYAFDQGVYSVMDIFRKIHDGTYPDTSNGYFFGGYDATSYYTTMEFINISVVGNATSFGNLSTNLFGCAGVSLQDGYSAVIGGGTYNSGAGDTTLVFLWKRYAQSELGLFNKLTYARTYVAAAASTTRAIFGGGDGAGYTDTIDWIPCANPENVATDFGNLYQTRSRLASVFSTTRAVFGGGTTDGSTNTDTMDYVAINTSGNAADFGTLTVARRGVAGVHDYSRGVFGGGYTTTGSTVMDYIAIGTTGNAATFGQLTTARNRLGGVYNATRGVFAGGANTINVMDYIAIQSAASANDFGDLTAGRYSMAAFSV